MEAKNIQGKNIGDIKSSFSKATEDGFNPTLAITFCSIMQNRKELAHFFKEKDIDVFGSTTAGEIIDSEILEQSIVVMLLDIKKAYFKLFFSESQDTYKLASKMAHVAKESFANPAIIVVSSGLTIDAEDIINGVHEFDSSLPLFGGLAGDDLTMKASYVFNSEDETSTGLLALILDTEHINISGLATSGWDNIGVEKTITKSDGNIVYTIDDEPAVDVFVKFFQFPESVYDRSEIIAMNFAQYPLQMKKENGNTVLRAPMMADVENRSMIFAGGIPEGSKVKFSVPPGFDLIDKTRDTFNVLKETMNNPDAVIIFSCKARHLALGPIMEDEAVKIRSIWNKPLIGLFTYGEIGTANDSICDFHNETCSLVLLEEKK